MKSKLWIFFLLVSGILLSACGLGLTSTQEVPQVEELLPPQVAAEIQNQVSQAFGVSIEDVQIVSIEQTDWADSCLGLPEDGESCAEVITVGWLVVYRIEGQEYRLRVNEDGSIIRQEP